MPATIIGREHERAALDAFVMGVKSGGSALVVRGDAGIGKTTLVEGAVARAGDEGMTVLAATGVRSEMPLAFAGLHQLLRPVIDVAASLAPPQLRALRAAFGRTDGPAADPYLAALGSLELLAELGATSPVLVVLEDAQWLDRPTLDALAFVARRLESEPIVMLVVLRSGYSSPFLDLEVPVLAVEQLGPDESAAILDLRAPDLAPFERDRILSDAAGNPLALLELPAAVPDDAPAGVPVAITDRLVQTFSDRARDLSDASRTALLVASLDQAAELPVTLAAAGTMAGRPVTLADVEAAELAGLVRVQRDALVFRHPLVPTAIGRSAPAATRRAAHAALALAHAGDPDRRAWHRAASLEGPDQTAVIELRSVASRAVERGAPQVAAEAVERAAALAPDPAERGRLLIQAAEMRFQLGRPAECAALLQEARGLPLPTYERTRLAFVTEVVEARTWSGGDRIPALVAMAGEMLDDGHVEESLDALLTIALRAWWSDVDLQTRDAIVDLAERLPLAPDAPPLLSIVALAHPMRCAADVIERISRIEPDPADPLGALAIGVAATGVWAHDLSVPFLEIAVDGLRVQGRLGLLTQALTAQAWSAVHLALEPLAVAASQEAVRLAEETAQPLWGAAARFAQAMILAERGDLEAAEGAAGDAEAVLTASGGGSLLALGQVVRARAAVAHHHCEDGLDYLLRMRTPSDPAFHPFVPTWMLSDLVEACVHTGRFDEARAYFAELEELAASTNGGLLRCEVAYARPFVTDDAHAEEAFQAALEALGRWPCFRGRMLLWYGRWLRRQRRVAESRAPLRAAKDAFESLAFTSLAEQAREELRAAGEVSTARKAYAWTTLSPQELQIAQLAATGLTNREIGERLFLSHRTVGSHLHRLFPKLGVTSRGQLRDALESAAPAEPASSEG
jgi:DNA-binding CsgD family transcriptional regulator